MHPIDELGRPLALVILVCAAIYLLISVIDWRGLPHWVGWRLCRPRVGNYSTDVEFRTALAYWRERHPHLIRQSGRWVKSR